MKMWPVIQNFLHKQWKQNFNINISQVSCGRHVSPVSGIILYLRSAPDRNIVSYKYLYLYILISGEDKNILSYYTFCKVQKQNYISLNKKSTNITIPHHPPCIYSLHLSHSGFLLPFWHSDNPFWFTLSILSWSVLCFLFIWWGWATLTFTDTSTVLPRPKLDIYFGCWFVLMDCRIWVGLLTTWLLFFVVITVIVVVVVTVRVGIGASTSTSFPWWFYRIRVKSWCICTYPIII